MQETPVHDSWVGKFPRRRERLPSPVFLGSPGILGLQTVKNPPAIRETWVQSLGWEDPLDEGMATHSSILAWRIPMDRGGWWATVHRVAKSRTQLKQLSTHNRQGKRAFGRRVRNEMEGNEYQHAATMD